MGNKILTKKVIGYLISALIKKKNKTPKKPNTFTINITFMQSADLPSQEAEHTATASSLCQRTRV